MASIDSFLGSSLQNLNTLDKKIANDGSDENMKKVVEYLYTLTEQLRYMFNNLDTENFTDGVFHRTIRDETTQQYTQIVQTNDALTAIVAGLNAAQKAAKLTFDAEGLSIQNGGFKILDGNNNATMTVSNSGDISIVGTYKTEAVSNANDTRWAELDTDTLYMYIQRTGETSKRLVEIESDVSYGGHIELFNIYGGRTISAGLQGNFMVYKPTTNEQNAYIARISHTSYGGFLNLHDTSQNLRVDLSSTMNGSVLNLNNKNNKTTIELSSTISSSGLWVSKADGSESRIRMLVNSSGVGNAYADNYNNLSSRRYKKDITDMSDEQAQKLLDLKFVKFKYKDRDTYNYGLIAEDTPLDEVVVCDEEGRPDAIDYTKLIPYMGKLIQEQDKRIKALEMKQ